MYEVYLTYAVLAVMGIILGAMPTVLAYFAIKALLRRKPR